MQARPTRVDYINVTPMIDVMLVLLIIFMVVVPVIAMKVDLPVAVNAQPKPHEPDEIVMIIDRSGAVFLEISGRQVPGLALRGGGGDAAKGAGQACINLRALRGDRAFLLSLVFQ